MIGNIFEADFIYSCSCPLYLSQWKSFILPIISFLLPSLLLTALSLNVWITAVSGSHLPVNYYTKDAMNLVSYLLGKFFLFQTNSTVHVGGMVKGVWLLQRTQNRIMRKMFIKVYQGLSRINVKNLKNCAISWAICKNVVVMTFSILKPMCRTRVKKKI